MKQRRASGFTYIGLLLMVALITAGVAAVTQSWHATVQRSKEAELQFIGEQFKRAIKLYYEGTPGADKQLPKTLEDLLRDARYPVVRRYLRKVFVDPMLGQAQWGLIKERDGIIGVHSLSTAVPFKNRSGDTDPLRRSTYADWKFIAELTLPPPQATTVKPVAVPSASAEPTPLAEPSIAQTPAAEPKPIEPRPKPSTDRCERLRAADARTCTANAARLGRPDAVCESSAASRYANCVSGAPAGQLWTE